MGTALGLVGLLSIGAVMWLAGKYVPRLDGWVEGAGAWAPVVYLAVCLVAGVLMVPGSATKLAAGALFGLGQGMVWGFLGAVLGSVAAFTVARFSRRSWLQQRLERLPRLQAFDHSVADDGRRIAILVRLSPLIPFNVLNYALGFSRVRARDYLLASFGMIPSIWLYVYSGQVARDLAEASGGGGGKAWWEWLVIAVGLGATVWVTTIVGRKASAAVRMAPEEAEAAATGLEGAPAEGARSPALDDGADSPRDPG